MDPVAGEPLGQSVGWGGPGMGAGMTDGGHSGSCNSFAPPFRPAGSRGLEPGHGAFAGQLPLVSASAAKMPNRRRPAAVVVAICAPSPASIRRACSAGRQVLHGVDQVGEVAAEAGRASRRTSTSPFRRARRLVAAT